MSKGMQMYFQSLIMLGEYLMCGEGSNESKSLIHLKAPESDSVCLCPTNSSYCGGSSSPSVGPGVVPGWRWGGPS